MEGYLYIWTNFICRWKKRFFILQNSIINCYQDRKSNVIGKIHISISKIIERKGLCFDIHNGITLLSFKAENDEEKLKWIKALNSAKLETQLFSLNCNKVFNNLSINENENKKINTLQIYVDNQRKMIEELKLLTVNLLTDKDKLDRIIDLQSNLTINLINIKKIINCLEKEYISKESNMCNIKTNDDECNSSENNVKIIKKSSEFFYEAESPKSEYESISKFYFDDSIKRYSLPAKREKNNYSIWEILKDAVGKDLNTFSIPVYFNEPLSMLQRMCENFQYAELLKRACREENSFLRLALISAFCISGFSQDPHRTLKYFNPLLSETYEYIDNELGFRYFSEQVSHHPAISACYVEGDGYIFYTNSNIKSKFKLIKNKLEFEFLSKSYVHLLSFNEVITFSKPIAAVKNLLTNVYVDCYGKFTVNNNSSGEYAEIEIYESNNNEQGKLCGEVKTKEGITKMIIEGDWLNYIDVIDIEKNTRSTIWQPKRIEGNAYEKYYFTDFSLNLNNLTNEITNILPRTDSRFRPDQRALENQNIDLAASEKKRLETKQRKIIKERNKLGLIYKPIFFKESYDDISGDLVYLYSRDYWGDRKRGNFKDLPDIF